ncbi:MAG: efflux RND transporter periplasmic adaptor subunit [Xanthobacteraceae bacterium]
MNPSLPILGAALACLIHLGGLAQAAESSSSQRPQVTVVRATNACFTAAIRLTGYLVAREEAIVSLEAPGAKVTEVLVDEGDRVTSGQTLVRLTRPEGQGDAASRNSTLRAPAAGRIIRSTATVGATASPMAEPLFRIAVDGEMELEADVPSVHVAALSPGQTARIEVGNGYQLGGRVRLVPAVIDRRTQLGRARLSLESDASLRLGMFARATIDANRSCGVSVPRAAVRYRTEGTSLQVVRNEAIETRLVQVGLHSDTDAEIREGLKEDELVVANAGSSLRDGDQVRPNIIEGTRTGQR